MHYVHYANWIVATKRVVSSKGGGKPALPVAVINREVAVEPREQSSQSCRKHFRFSTLTASGIAAGHPTRKMFCTVDVLRKSCKNSQTRRTNFSLLAEYVTVFKGI